MTLEQSSVSGHEFLDVVFTKHPKLRDHASSIRIAVNYDFVELTTEIKDGAEGRIGTTRPGGAPNYLVTEEALEPLDAWHAVANDRAGATVLFIGTVRNHSRGKDVEALEYEAYVPMVEKTLDTIASACDTTNKESQTFIAHRYGSLKIRTSVVIASSAPHRAEAFDACRQAIESIKTDVPIFKREKTSDGEEWVGFGGG